MLNENLSFQFNDNQESSQTKAAVTFKIQLSAKSQVLHTEALKRAGKYLVAEASLLEIIMKIDQERLYEEFQEAHLTPYCVNRLGLSESVAANFVRVARKSLQVPQLKEAIDEGRITLSDAKAISSVITPENQLEWIGKAEELSKNNLEIEVAKASPKAKKPEKARPQGENRVRVEFELTDEEMNQFKRAQDLVSQTLGKSASLAETQKVLLAVFLDKKDPVRKAQRAKDRADKKSAQGKTSAGNCNSDSNFSSDTAPNRVSQSRRSQEQPQDKQEGKDSNKSSAKHQAKKSRKPLPAEVLHAVNLRDKGCCQARLPDGSICASSKWVHLHHIVPVAKGGLDTSDNLITLCSAHHRIWHRHDE